MFIRLSYFYASLFLLLCLGMNIAFFSEVREPFLGSDDPLASIKSSFAALDIPSQISELYNKLESESKPVKSADTPSVNTSPQKPASDFYSPQDADPFLNPGPLPAMLLDTPKEPVRPPVIPAGSKELQPKDFERQPIENQHIDREPAPQTASVQPIVAELQRWEELHVTNSKQLRLNNVKKNLLVDCLTYCSFYFLCYK